jgi:hypothetical protein
MFVVTTLRRQRQEDLKFEASPGKVVMRPCFKIKTRTKGLGV